MPTKERVYWDSDVFISFLQKHPERYGVLRQLIECAENGEVEIVASAFSLCEVARVDDAQLPHRHSDMPVQEFTFVVRAAMNQSFLHLSNNLPAND